MQTLRGFAAMEQPVDLLMCNYVYEHVVDNTHHTVSYKSILPQDVCFPGMRSAIFRRARTF